MRGPDLGRVHLTEDGGSVRAKIAGVEDGLSFAQDRVEGADDIDQVVEGHAGVAGFELVEVFRRRTGDAQGFEQLAGRLVGEPIALRLGIGEVDDLGHGVG